MVWHAIVVRLLLDSGLFSEVSLIGGKVRAKVDLTRYLDIHFDPTTRSYSYALIDLSLSYPGDKRRFGWDDYPHPGDLEMAQLTSYPHHYQERLPDGRWRFVEPLSKDG